MTTGSPGPTPLGRALSELVALRGLAQTQGLTQLAELWKRTAGPGIAARTRVTAFKAGVLHVAVGNSPLLGELVGFHKEGLLAALQQSRADLRIEDIRFRLRGDIG